MASAKGLDYTIHHLCIYDKDPHNHIWPYLKWHHRITGYFTGDTFHIADARSGVRMARLREPSGNLIHLRQAASS